MAGKKIYVKKYAGAGLTGSSSGMRFNPRDGPEMMEEDRNLGNDDPESRQVLEEKKRKEKEQRAKKITGLKHLSLKIPQKKRPTGDGKRNDEELSEMTGPTSSTGAPLDAATGAKTGSGSAVGGAPVNIMTGYPMEEGFDILLKNKKGGRHGKTHTITTRRRKAREKSTRRLRRKRGKTSLDLQFTGKHVGNPQSRNPKTQSTTRHETTQRVGSSGTGPIKHGHSQRGRGARTMRRSVNPDPRKIHKSAEMSQVEREVPAHTAPTNLASQQGMQMMEAGLSASSGVRIHDPHVAASDMTPSARQAPQQSRVDRTHNVGGVAMPLGDNSAGPAGTSGMTGFVPQSPTASMFKMSIEELDSLIQKAKISGADITEFKWLVRELRRLLNSGALRKAGMEDAEHDDERPTPNSHRQTTSHPTGATEVDPEDDPRYWGAHPIGLLLPRRGHM